MSSNASVDKAAPYSVYTFLHDECIISRYYTIPLNEMAIQYSKTADFIGIFPNPQVSDERLQQFEKEYDITFQLYSDPSFELVDRFKATVTPEVFVIDNLTDQIVYQGRIDNAYARVGKKRTIVTRHELHDVLTALENGQEVAVEQQPAIGCIITRIKTN